MPIVNAGLTRTLTPSEHSLTTIIPNNTDTGINRGIGPNTYTCSTVRYVQNFEGRLVYVQPNCPSFPGLRSVSNLLTYSADFSNAAWAPTINGTGTSIKTPNFGVAPDGNTTACRVQLDKGSTGGSYGAFKQDMTAIFSGASITRVMSVWLKTNDGTTKSITCGDGWVSNSTITITGVWQRFCVTKVGSSVNAQFIFSIDFNNGALPQSIDLLMWHPQYENVTGSTNQNPSEYAPTTSTPVTIWKDYTNPNVVDGNGVVTQIATTPITTGKDLLSEPAGTNLINNSIAPATQSITVTAQQYTLSCMGIGSVTLSGTGSGSITGVSATDIKTLTFTPTAGTLTLTLTGSLTALQVETGGVNTSFMLSSGATSTRAATVDSYQTAANLPAFGVRHISLVWTPIAVTGTQYLWSSGTATDHTAILYDGTNIILRKRVASVNQDAIKPLAAVISTTYTIDGYIYADNSTAVGVNGALGTPNANATAIQTAATMELGSLNGASQTIGNFGPFRILTA